MICFNRLVCHLIHQQFFIKLVKKDIYKLIYDLRNTVFDTDLTITLKFNVLLCHVVPTLKLPFFKGCGLGICSEQAGESIHSYFESHFWIHLAISDIMHPQYSKNLKKSVVECVSKAI